MRLLALDTTTRLASAALVDDDRTIGVWSSDPGRAHAEQLPRGLLEMVTGASRSGGSLRLRSGRAGEFDSIDVFAVAVGPGSFTGLRIGIATIQGLAFVGGKRIVPLSVLEALAVAGGTATAGHRAAPHNLVVAAWMDAHRREVFSALYRCEAGNAGARPAMPVLLDAPAVGDPRAVLTRWHGGGLRADVYIGDGALLYRDLLAADAVVIPPPPLAETIAQLALPRARAGETVDPAAVQPLYVRRPDAETARDAHLAR